MSRPQFKGSLYCRPEKRGQPLEPKTSTTRCKECGKRRRGRNHDQGQHHLRAIKKKNV